MQHLKILIALIIFITSLYVTFYVHTIKKQYKFSYLKKIVLYMWIYNIFILFLNISLYFKVNLSEKFFFNNSHLSQNISSLIFNILVYIFIYLMISIVTEFLNKTISKGLNGHNS